MHNANTTALTLRAVIAAIVSLVLSLGSLLKAVVIISDLQSLKSARDQKKGKKDREVKLGLKRKIELVSREDWTIRVCLDPRGLFLTSIKECENKKRKRANN